MSDSNYTSANGTSGECAADVLPEYGSTLPLDAVLTLKKALDQHLRSNNVYDKIRGVVGEFVAEQRLDFDGEDKVLAALRQKGLIQDIVTSLSSVQPALNSPVKLLPNRRYLVLRVKGARSFVEHLVLDDAEKQPYSLYMFLQFRQQRMASRPVPASVNPEFSETFVLDMQAQDDGDHQESQGLTRLSKLVRMKEGIHMVIVREDRFKQRNVIASQFVEWRKVLVHGRLSLCVELFNRFEHSRAPIGVVDLDFELVPLPKKKSSPKTASQDDVGIAAPVFVEQQIITAQLVGERTSRTRATRQFHSYAKAWWNDYVNIRPSHQNRVIKMFGRSEDESRRFICTFVRPLSSGRLLDSALHAARLVRLIPFKPSVDLGGERSEVWHSMHTFLSQGEGDIEDHCVLLCSLLLGFGLNAFICVGRNRQGPHMWVVTLESKTRCVFWDSVTGQRYSVDMSSLDDEAAAALPFNAIGCVFDHRNFFANVQVGDSVRQTRWDLDNPSCWKKMRPEAIAVLPQCEITPMYPCTLDLEETCSSLEFRLRSLIENYRHSHVESSTKWDRALSYILTPALSAYEAQIVTGQSFGNEFFQQSIKNYIPVNYAFKAFPVQFEHRDSNKMMAFLLSNQSAMEILQLRGAEVELGLRCKIIPYAEDICAVWIMIAAKFIVVD